MIEVFRLGHRIHRDYRLTMHVALTARAFLADKIYYSGQKDSEFENNVIGTVEKFGGNFKVEYIKDWKGFLKDYKGKIVHLTMYGLPFNDVIDKIEKDSLLIIVGGEKVEKDVFDVASYNLSVTSQPISEVSALAVFLHELNQGRELNKDFDGKVKIIPQSKGKKIER